MRMRTPSTCTVLTLVVLLAGCGGGGGGGEIAVFDIVYQRVESTPSRTGTVYEIGGVEVGAELVVAGDLDSGHGVRAFQSFPLGTLPAPDQLESVTYVDGLWGATGTPYTSLGELQVSATDIGSSLDQSDYEGPAIRVALGTLSTTGGFGVERTVDLTSHVRQLLEGGGDRLDFMIAFERETDDDGQADMQWLGAVSAEDGPGHLRVGVRIPR